MIHQVTTNDNEWYEEWQLVATSGTMTNNEWQQVITSDREWQRVVISVKVTFLLAIRCWYDYFENEKVIFSLHQKIMQIVVADIFKIYVDLFPRWHSIYKRSKRTTDHWALHLNVKWHQCSSRSVHTKQSVLYVGFTHFRFTISDFRLTWESLEPRTWLNNLILSKINCGRGPRLLENCCFSQFSLAANKSYY